MDGKQLIVFDLDGTLAQTYYSEDNSYIGALSEMIPLDPDFVYWKDCLNLTDSAVFHHIFKAVTARIPSEQEELEMKERFIKKLQLKKREVPEFFKEIPGAQRMVQALNSQHQVGVATGGWDHIARFKLTNIGIEPESIDLIGSDNHHAKVDFLDALIQRVNKQRSYPFQKITYVGDSTYDMKAAASLGLDFIGVDFRRTGELKNAGVQKVVEHYEDEALFDYLGL